MSINALSPNRFTPSPQQARLNPQVAQQRQGVTFSPETLPLFEQAAQIIHIMHREKGPALYAAFREGLGKLIRNSDTCSGEIRLYPAFVMERLRQPTVEILISHEGQKCHSISFYIPLETPETFRDRFDLALKSLPSTPRLNSQVDNPGIEGVDDREWLEFDQTIRKHVKKQMPQFNRYVKRNLAPHLRQKIREDAGSLFG